MKYLIGMTAVLSVVITLCSGCDRSKETVPAPEKNARAEEGNWAPETATAADLGHVHGENCDHDH